jgi:quinol-cytochrome oxidoreductase complex cytochrome b subunit
MDITVLVVGLIVLAIFILPFYYVSHVKSKNPKPEEHNHDAVNRELNHPKTRKQHAKG